MAVRTVRNANVDTDLTTIALSGLDSAAGMVVQTATDTFTKRTLTAANGIGITDPTGAGGNPTFAINPAKVQQFVATYAALTALVTATGLIDNGIYYTYGRATEEDGCAGFWRYDSGSSATANGGTILAIDGGGAGRFFRLTSEAYNVRWFGALGDNSTDDTSAFTATGTAAAAAGRAIYIPGGTYIVANWTPPTNTVIYGDGVNDTILKRPNSAASNASVINLTATGVYLRDLQVNGNKANNALGSNNISATGGYNYTLERVWSHSAKTASGYGGGIVFSATTDQSAVTRTSALNCVVTDNDSSGIIVDECWNIRIEGNRCVANGGSGIALANFDAPIEPQSQRRIVIRENYCASNTANGIQVAGTTTDNIMPVAPDLQAYDISIQDNQCMQNGTYGIAAQGQLVECSGNQCFSNGGTGSTYAGILFNCYVSVCTGNICTTNEFYGIDAGGSVNSQVCDNVCSFNGNATVGSGVGINIGGSQDVACDDNTLINNGGLGSAIGKQIACAGYELNGSGAGFPYRTRNVSISNNLMLLSASTQSGIYVRQGGSMLVVHGNSVRGGVANNAIVLETDSVSISNNVHVDAINGVSVASAATPVIPDWAQDVIITGTTQITGGIKTYSENAYFEKVAYLTITNGGSGYTSAPTVSFTGGGGSGAAATAYVGTGGAITSILMTNFGSGYTSTPTVSFTGGGGSGAAATATVGIANRVGRRTFTFSGASGVNHAGSVYLLGSKNFYSGSGGRDTLSVIGASSGTAWYETSRANAADPYQPVQATAYGFKVGGGNADATANTTALQAALDANYWVQLPSGTAYINKITHTRVNRLSGLGQTETILVRANNLNDYALYASAKNDMIYEDFTLNMNRANNTGSGSHTGIRLEGGCSRWQLRRVKVTGARGTFSGSPVGAGFSSVGGGSNGQIENSWFDDCYDGVVLSAHTDARAVTCWFTANTRNGCLVAAASDRFEAHGVYAVGNSTTYGGAGLQIIDSPDSKTYGGTFNSNTLGHGLQHNNSDRCETHGGTYNSNGISGLDFFDSVDAKIFGGYATLNAVRGLEVDSASNGAIVTGFQGVSNTDVDISVFRSADVQLIGCEGNVRGWDAALIATATVSAGGTGYTVGDVLTVSGGTKATAATFTVATLSGSAVATVTVSNGGNYWTFPTEPASVTGGTGTGATFTFTATAEASSTNARLQIMGGHRSDTILLVTDACTEVRLTNVKATTITDQSNEIVSAIGCDNIETIFALADVASYADQAAAATGITGVGRLWRQDSTGLLGITLT